jgi:hypothetical protein
VYATCLFCNTHLGRNETIEQFPVGKRLAFDPAKGRLWVVCPQCKQWNLTPLEERWEAIEDCERRFRDARRRVSTGEIGLARLPGGLALIRIGQPLLPEMAAWRFGPRLQRRRRQALALAATAALLAGGVIVGGVEAGIITSVPVVFVWNGRFMARYLQHRRVVARIPDDSGQVLTVRGGHAARSRFLRGQAPGSWRLNLLHEDGGRLLEGPSALDAARKLLAGINRFGGSAADVRDATEHLGHAKDANEYISAIAGQQDAFRKIGITALPRTVRLALEMAAHDEAERRAMDGELRELADAWRRAEEIAAIADNMFLPPSVEAFFRRLA